ncbi:MAG TPA: beta-propeller fold lactonase family protein [Bacteroidales bacterium]|nr:beta-propeller fold lactonase family protein [Bacteroidales bacterium]
MNRLTKIFIYLGIIVALGLLVYFPGRKAARAHVNYITATDDHPLLCTKCHLYTQKTGIFAKMVNADYLSPFNLAVSDNGKLIFVVAQDADALLIVDAESHKVLDKIPVEKMPHSVLLSKDGSKAYVSNEWADDISVIDVGSRKVIDTLKTGDGPAGLALSSDGNYLYVVNSYTSDVSIIDLRTGKELKRLDAGNNPTGIRRSPDGQVLFVTSRRANFVPYGDPLVTELTIINDSTQRVEAYSDMNSAYMMENVAFTPSGDLGFVTLIRPKNLMPAIQVEQGWMMTHGFGVIDRKNNNKVYQFLTDEPNAYYSNPFGIAITPDGKKAFISSSGSDIISVIAIDSVKALIARATPELLKYYPENMGLSRHFVIKRIPTGSNPKGITLSPDGKKLYVAESLEDKIAVINTETLEEEGSIDLGGPKRVTVARLGRKLFNNAGHTFQDQYSCYTCHPDMHEDGLVYNMSGKDMGRNVTNTESLRDIKETAPFKWTGTNQSVYKQDGMRFSTFLTRTEAFSYKQLDALVSYIITGIHYPPNLLYNPNGELTEAQKRGKEIFDRKVDNFGKEIPEKDRCITCHPPPYYTNRKLEYVETLSETDDSVLFDTPHLTNIYASAPYLHDGRAATLEEIWTKYAKNDKHGHVNDMTKNQLNDLVEYLRSLRDPEYDKTENKIHQASINPH